MGAGTPRKCTIDGLSMDFAADADITEEVGQETEGIATSGKTMAKITKKVAIRQFELICDDDDWEAVQTSARKLESFPMSYENVNGSIYRATGLINIENRTTSENRVALSLIPDNGWTKF